MKVYHERMGALPFAHWKYDGICLDITRDRQGMLSAWTRTPRDIVGKLMRCKWLQGPSLRMPLLSSVMGELYVPGQPASYVSTAIASNPDLLRFRAFCISMPKYARAPLSEAKVIAEKWGFDFAPWFHLRGQNSLFSEGEYTSIDSLMELPQPTDTEGYVLKHDNGSESWKVKRFNTVDCIVTGFIPGQGKYLGMPGALVVSLFDGTELASVSGMTDKQRQALRGEDLGRVCEVKYQYVGAGGRLRHPTFVRWRDDKPAHECNGKELR